jgi:hypothetical protein
MEMNGSWTYQRTLSEFIFFGVQTDVPLWRSALAPWKLKCYVADAQNWIAPASDDLGAIILCAGVQMCLFVSVRCCMSGSKLHKVSHCVAHKHTRRNETLISHSRYEKEVREV